MGRPPQNHADIRNMIIERAGRVFARFGFKKTTMNEIAHSLSKTKGSIYYYYKSKEEIFAAIVEREGNIAQAELRQAVNRESDPALMLRTYILTRMRFMNHLGNLYAALREDYLRHYSFIEKLRETITRSEQEMINHILQTGISQGVFAVKDPELASFALVMALKGLEFSVMSEKTPDDIEHDADILLEMLLNGLKKR